AASQPTRAAVRVGSVHRLVRARSRAERSAPSASPAWPSSGGRKAATRTRADSGSGTQRTPLMPCLSAAPKPSRGSATLVRTAAAEMTAPGAAFSLPTVCPPAARSSPVWSATAWLLAVGMQHVRQLAQVACPRESLRRHADAKLVLADRHDVHPVERAD